MTHKITQIVNRDYSARANSFALEIPQLFLFGSALFERKLRTWLEQEVSRTYNLDYEKYEFRRCSLALEFRTRAANLNRPCPE